MPALSHQDLALIIGIPVIAIGCAIVFGILIPRVRRRRRLHGDIPLTMLATPSGVIPPRPTRQLPTSPVMSPAQPAAPASAPVMAAAPPEVPVERNVVTRTGTDNLAATEGALASDAPRLRLETSAPEVTATRAEVRPPSARRSHRSTLEGTLQFLPGRLEVVEGRDVGQEVRFVRQQGEEQTVVTLGRGEGVPYKHVQLHEPTVSRMHAKLTREGKQWRISNLSATNPVVINGTPLEGEDASHVLAEGDRIELGEVVFRFRAK